VGGPSGVTNPRLSVKGLFSDDFLKLRQLPDLPADLDLSPMKNGDTCGIISTVFESLESIQQNFSWLSGTYISHDPTHCLTLVENVKLPAYPARSGTGHVPVKSQNEK
jgi:hypothetical protein